MAEFFASGRVVDLILGLILLELIVLFAWRRIGAKGPRPVEFAANLAAGAFLMLALRSALIRDPWTATAAWLLAGLAAHLLDLWGRLRRP